MGKTMLEYVKLILEKVSFDKALFEKELKKGVSYLLPPEVNELKKWCYSRFGQTYLTVLNRIFKRNSPTDRKSVV